VQAALFAALAEAKEAEAETLRDEDEDPGFIAEINAELKASRPARKAHRALVRALEPPEPLIAYGYRKMVIRRRTRPATP
jgi:hypothetical protein